MTAGATKVSETAERPSPPVRHANGAAARKAPTAFGCPRDFLNNRFVYIVVSPRSRGLSIGVNLNPDKHCNFDCVYCEVDRRTPSLEPVLDVDVMADELQKTIQLVRSGEITHHPFYGRLPANLLQLKGVALSGDGEPTLSPQFADAVRAVVHLRARGISQFFKIVLITNSTGLDLPGVQEGIDLLTSADEIWAKLDAGTQSFMDQVNRGEASLPKVLSNILALARRRPVIIQSLFCSINGKGPADPEIVEYAARLNELKAGGAQIPLVQIYSATRPVNNAECGHLSLKQLSTIARQVRETTGLKTEVF